MNSNEWAQAFETSLKPLWLLAHAGDEAAYCEALSLIAGRLRGYFFRRMSSMSDEVEDLVQETLMAIHVKRGSYDSSLPVTAWVLSIGRYKLIDFWRRHERRESLNEDIDQIDESLLVVEAPLQGASLDLDKLLSQLPAAQRAAIELTKLQGLSVAQAAHHSGMSESSIKVSVHRGMRRMGQWVGKLK